MNGVGVLASGDMEVTSTATANEISVGAGDLWVPGTVHTLGSAETHVLSDNTSGSDRWDTVVLDTSTGSSAVKEGVAETNPEPPALGTDEILLAYVYVPDGATDTPDSRIYNWRTFSTDAADVRLADSAGDYSSNAVEGALSEVIREAGDPLNGPLDLSSFSGGSVLDLGTNPTAFGAIVDAEVDGNSSAGTVHSYDLAVDGTTLLRVYAESDGSGGIQNSKIVINQDVDLPTGSVGSGEIASGAVGSSEIATDAVGSDEISTGAVGTDEVADGSLTDGDIFSSTTIARGKLDDQKTTTTDGSSTYTTSDEEVVFVPTSTVGSSTITLASADADDGNTIVVSDSEGAASSNPMTVDTESSETIHGQSSKTIETDGGALVFTSDGTNWSLGGGGAGGGGGVTVEDDQTIVTDPAEALSAGAGLSATDDGDESATLDLEHAEVFEGRESGSVSDTNQGVLIVDNLPDRETVEIYKAVFLNADGTPVASGADLELVTLDNSGGFTSRSTILSGDGSTVYDDQTGSPLASYSNTSGGGQTIGVLVDNGTGGSITIIAAVEGVTGL